MTKFTGTIGRRKINLEVAKHLQETLTWCNSDACDNRKFAPIRNANTHDDMVKAIKTVTLKLLSDKP